MTPQEKAKELIEKFHQYTGEFDVYKVDAKQCALICVEECLDVEMSKLTDTPDQKFWDDVKTALNDL